MTWPENTGYNSVVVNDPPQPGRNYTVVVEGILIFENRSQSAANTVANLLRMSIQKVCKDVAARERTNCVTAVRTVIDQAKPGASAKQIGEAIVQQINKTTI